VLGDGWRHSESVGRAHLVRLQLADGRPEVIGWNRADDHHGVCERPAPLAWVQLGNLGVDGFHIWAGKQAGQNRSEPGDAGVRVEVATYRTKIVVPVEEALDWDHLRLGLGRKLSLQGTALRVVHQRASRGPNF
jgi:hypothetical protein